MIVVKNTARKIYIYKHPSKTYLYACNKWGQGAEVCEEQSVKGIGAYE